MRNEISEDTYDKGEDDYVFAILGIGDVGCQTLRYLRDSGKFDDSEHLMLIGMHSDVAMLAQSDADYTLLLRNDIGYWDEAQQLPTPVGNDHLIECISDMFKKIDVSMFLIFTDIANSHTLGLTFCLLNLLKQKTLSTQRLTVVIINEPDHSESLLTLHQNFAEARRHLPRYVDTALVNSTNKIRRLLRQAQRPLTDYRQQTLYVNYQAARLFIDPMLMPGTICVDFADLYSVCSRMGEAIIAVGQGSGADRAESAALDALRQLKQECGGLGNPEIGAIFSYILAQDVGMAEFRKLGELIFEEHLGESVRIKLAVSIDDRSADGSDDLMEIAIMVVKQKGL